MSERYTEFFQAIKRSQAAYDLYLKSKTYYQANRIYKANKQLYSMAEKLYLVDDVGRKGFKELIFHLDDWFLQYEEHVRQLQPKLDDVFVFERIDGMFPHPTTFINNIIETSRI